MKCRAMTVLLPILLTGCALLTNPKQPAERPRIIISPNVDAVEARVMQELRNNPLVGVTQYALSACDTSNSWLPSKGPIKDIQFWRALHRERQLKQICADKHGALRGQVKASFGEIYVGR